MTCCSKWFRVALWSVVSAAVGLAAPGSAAASEKGVLAVKDNGAVFSTDGVRKAEQAFEAVTFQAPTKLAVVTFAKVPEGKRAAFDEAKSGDAKNRFFREWAEEVARSSGKPDVLVFISMEGSHVRAIDDRRTEIKRGFDDADLRTLREKFVAGFKPSAEDKDAAAKIERHDAALLASVNFVAEQLKDTTLPANGKRANGAANNAAETKGSNIMSYVCIGIVALLGIWLVFGLVRMMMGGSGGGGGGYGGGGMGGGGMGGGGGRMTGLLGGMLGAVAGNYLYNSFMGGNHSSDSMGSNGGGYGDSGTTGDTGAGDYSGGGDSGGGDFSGGDSGGSDFGGGDSGGGGSDFGGGGDSGGGDW